MTAPDIRGNVEFLLHRRIVAAQGYEGLKVLLAIVGTRCCLSCPCALVT